MIKMRLIYLTVILGLNLVLEASGAGIPADVISALKEGDANKLSQSFHTTIELTIEGKEQICSKVQAELIIRDFFKNNKPIDCKVLHQSGSSTRYSIIQLKTSKESYRVTLLLKPVNDVYRIHQLRID